MPNVLDLRRRIRSVRNTRQITKAMKMVSAAKLRRAQERALAARPYASMLASVMQSLKRHIDVFDPVTGDVRHPLLLTRPEKNVLLLVISGDKGFAGAFNTNIVKAAMTFLGEHGDKQIDVETLGRKGRDLFRRRFPASKYQPGREEQQADGHRERRRSGRVEFIDANRATLDRLTFEDARQISGEIVDRYVHEEIDSAYIVYNEFKSVIQQRVVVEQVLPIVEETGDLGKRHIVVTQEMSTDERRLAAEAAMSSGVSIEPAERRAAAKEAEEEARRFGTASSDYIIDQPPRELLDAILPRFIASQIYHATIESVAAEHAARMTAMDAATNNATEMLDSLTLTMNRARQAAITKEIIEIVSGAAALS